MKKLLFIILLLTFISGYGQGISPSEANAYMDSVQKTLPLDHMQRFILADTTTSCKIRKKYDTIPVLMLVSDTAQFEQDRITKKREEREQRMLQDTTHNYAYVVDFPTYTQPQSYHMKGYEVLKPIGTHAANTDDGNGMSYTVYVPATTWGHAAWLDANKKPLKKEIVVWMSKEIKK